MKQKKFIIINTILLFALMFLAHNLYEWLPNDFIAIFFPVNESIWEHMKMIYTTMMIYSIIELFIFKKFKIEYNNFVLSTYISSIITILVELILFVPIYKLIGENMIVTLTTLVISLFVGQIINYIILKKDYIKHSNIISIIFIIITFIAMGYLTYKPPINFLFYDSKEEKYGMNIYTV